MILLAVGLALWVGAHLFKGVAPAARGALHDRIGGATKGVFAALLALSVILMIWGYRRAPFLEVYAPPEWGVHVVDLGMFFALALFGLGNSKSLLRDRIRHPQLWGFALWSALHLLVNGDAASVLLWGTLLIWALLEMPVINARDGAWAGRGGGSLAGTVRLGLIALVLYALVTSIHAWLGAWPFPR